MIFLTLEQNVARGLESLTYFLPLRTSMTASGMSPSKSQRMMGMISPTPSSTQTERAGS